MRLFDAHNHLFDERLAPYRSEIIRDTPALPVVMVVNGSCEDDWDDVLALAKRHTWILPSFGYHPWYVSQATASWEDRLVTLLGEIPSAIGEVGIDHWIEGRDDELQERIFLRQIEIAAELHLPVSIHCLRAFGRLLELLKAAPRLKSGFLLHSYGGPKEMVSAFADLGGYFSFPGFFLGPHRERKQDAFRAIPIDRLLVETDAPDQCLPADLEAFTLPPDSTGKRLNDPRNIRRIYEGLSELLAVDLSVLAHEVERNFLCLFGKVLRKAGTYPGDSISFASLS